MYSWISFDEEETNPALFHNKIGNDREELFKKSNEESQVKIEL